MYKISSFTFKINNHDHINMPDNMRKFYVDHQQYQYLYDIYVIDHIDIIEDSFVIEKNNIKISIKNGLEKRYLYIMGDISPYAVCEEIDEKHSVVHVHQAFVNAMNIDTMFVSLLSLERRMNVFHQYILHSSYMLYHDHAILFSAPSGTGKSTQAGLWEKYRGARTINGDRTLISKEDGVYYANGWPICGSSEICFNERYPLDCIVVLSQGKENKIEELSYKDSFKKILSELTINFHNVEFVNQAMDFIEDLISHVKIYHLTCDISEDAVKCLEKRLEDDIWMR